MVGRVWEEGRAVVQVPAGGPAAHTTRTSWYEWYEFALSSGIVVDKTRTSAGTSLVGRRVVVRVVPWAIRLARESRGYRLKMRRGLLCLLFATELELIRMLIEDNWLRCLIDTACPWCCIGKLGPLNDVPGRSYVHRCHSKGCQKYVHPHAFRPIFQTTVRGTKHVPLLLQCAIVFALIAPAAVCILA